MDNNYDKFLSTKLFLVEQLAVKGLSKNKDNIVYKKILEVTSGSYEDIKDIMDNGFREEALCS